MHKADLSRRSARKRLKARINQLAIPPAWREVCIAADARAPISRPSVLQYRYHPNWDKARATAKETRLKRLGSSLPRVRGAVRKALATPGLTRTKVVAAVVRLIDRALLRPGNEEYARSEGGRGASTLLKTDVAVNGNQVVLVFKGKGGKEIGGTSATRCLRAF